jgi:hypothetical protein
VASVPWIKVSTSFFEHKKTIKLRATLGTTEPILRLWAWAAQCADSGDLTGIGALEIEDAIGWRGEAGKAFAAFVACGFVDDIGESTMIHGWEEHTGGGVSNLLNRRKKQREIMRERRVRLDVSKDVSANNEPNRELTSSLLSSSSGSSLNSGSETANARDPSATGTEQSAPRTSIATADGLIHWMRIAIEKAQPESGRWNSGGSFAVGDARGFLESFDGEIHDDEIRKRVDLFAADKSMAPWTVKRFVAVYNGIGQPKAPSDDRRQYPHGKPVSIHDIPTLPVIRRKATQ